MVGTEHDADLGSNWHLSVLREKGQIMMLLYCHFPESPVCRALTPRVPPVFILPASPHGFMWTSSFQKIISTSLILTENKQGEVASKERMHRKKNWQNHYFSCKWGFLFQGSLKCRHTSLRVSLITPSSGVCSPIPTERPGCCCGTTIMASDSRYDPSSLSVRMLPRSRSSICGWKGSKFLFGRAGHEKF